MTPVPRAKTYGPGAAALIRMLCHFINKYNPVLQVTLRAVITDPVDLAAAIAFLASVDGACTLFNKYWPPETT